MRLSHLVGRTAALLRHTIDTAMAQHGASFAEFLVLHVVATQPGLSQRDLADIVGVERPTMSHHLDRLESEGLVVRQRDDADRRLVRVRPTPAGRRRLAKLDALAERLEADLAAELPDGGADELRRLLTGIVDAVEHGRMLRP